MTTPITAIKSMCGLLRGGNVTYPVPQEAAAMIEALIAERDAAVALLAEITPSRLIGESRVPYPEGKTTILMSWDWLRRVRAIERGDHITEAKP